MPRYAGLPDDADVLPQGRFKGLPEGLQTTPRQALKKEWEAAKPIDDWEEVHVGHSRKGDIFDEVAAGGDVFDQAARQQEWDSAAPLRGSAAAKRGRDVVNSVPPSEQQRMDFVRSQGAPATVARYGSPYSNVSFRGASPAQVDTRGIATPRQKEEAERISTGAHNALIGVGAGMYDDYKGIEQAGALALAGLGLVKPETVARITQEGQEARNDFAPLKDQSTAASVGEFVGKVAPFLAVPVGAPEALLGRIGAGAATGAGMGALDFVPDGNSRTMNAATGAAFGGAGAAALAGVSKVYNAAANNPLIQNARQQLSERFKIPATLSELTGGSSRADSILEQVPGPFGIKGFRQEQQQAAKDAATAHFGQYVVDPTLDTTAGMKAANDAHLDSLYQKVRVNATHLPQAAAPEVKQAAGELLDRYPGVFDSIQDTHIKRILRDIKGDTSTKTVGTGVLNAQGAPITRQVEPRFSFDDLWTLRKGLGKEIGDASTNTAKGQLSALYSAVSTDMDAMLAGKGGEALQDFRTANDAFKQYSVKFDVMRQAYDKAMGTTGAGTAGFFSPQKYGTALKNLANNPIYKKNIRWTPGEIEEMTGLANILQVTKRAGQFMENPPTGNRWGLPSMATAAGGGSYLAGGAAATVKTAGASAAAALITKFLTTTQAGKRLALSASKVQPTSPAMKAILGQIYGQIPKVTAEATLNSSKQSEAAPEEAPFTSTLRKWKTLGDEIGE